VIGAAAEDVWICSPDAPHAVLADVYLWRFKRSIMEDSAAQPASVSLGKGAWDCDLNVAIPPEKEVIFLRHMSDHDSYD